MRAVWDACVLYPTLPRLVLTGCAQAGLCAPLWSVRIVEEWRRAVLRHHPEQAEPVAAEIAALAAVFRDACTAPDVGLEATLALPDPDDRHVLATAIAGGADAIVTFNMADFPGRTLARYGIRPRHPDGLLCEWFDTAPDLVAGIVAAALAPLGPGSPRAALKRAKLPRLGKALSRTLPERPQG